MKKLPGKPTDASGESPSGGLDLSVVAALAKIAAHHDLSEVEIEHEGLRVRVARERRAPAQMTYAVPASAAPTAAPVAAASEASAAPTAPADHPGSVKSPMV